MGISRKDKICFKCANFVKETETVEAECLEEENINESAFCHSFSEKEV